MLVQLLGMFAEFERETIVDRVTNGMATKAANGKWPGGHRPYGYRADPQTQKLTPHPGAGLSGSSTVSTLRSAFVLARTWLTR
jgi:DNA invertase Pin-like site-specific DNA recombinase